jgi:hypothetical protein
MVRPQRSARERDVDAVGIEHRADLVLVLGELFADLAAFPGDLADLEHGGRGKVGFGQVSHAGQIGEGLGIMRVGLVARFP